MKIYSKNSHLWNISTKKFSRNLRSNLYKIIYLSLKKKTYMKDEQIFLCCRQRKKGNNKKQKEHVNLNATETLNKMSYPLKHYHVHFQYH